MGLIEEIRDGNEVAFELAYKQWRSKGFYYFLRKTEVEEDAKDLLQTTFLKFWQYRKSLSPDYTLDQQLFHIARTVFIDYLRKENKQSDMKISFGNEIETKSLVNIQSMEFDVRDRLREVLETMPFYRRRAFELHKLQGYSYKEIAESLEITEKAVDNHLAKALKQLRKAFISLLLLLTIIGWQFFTK